MSSENKLLQNYTVPGPVTDRFVLEYKQQLAKAISARDLNRCKVLVSLLAVLDPIKYINYLNKRKKNVEK